MQEKLINAGDLEKRYGGVRSLCYAVKDEGLSFRVALYRGGEPCVLIAHTTGIEELNVVEGEVHFFERPLKRRRSNKSSDAA
jgi:hypothetical protein